MPNDHAKLSPSSAHRWLKCTAAPKFEGQFTDFETSVYAEEGTLAHSICELYVKHKFQGMTTRKFNAELKKLKANELFSEEMLTTAQTYLDYLDEKALSYSAPPVVAAEVRVDISDYVPECFGTCDCIMIGDETLHITDYKHGKGVAVSAKDNPQMKLYALGALKMFSIFYDIKRVSMAICQPRLSATVEEDSMTAEELVAWGESIKPAARAAFDGNGIFAPGDHCRFCKARQVCRSRAKYMLELEALTDRRPAKATPIEEGVTYDLTDEEIGDILTRGAGLIQWYNDISAYALEAILHGNDIPGYKAVEGRSVRTFTDADAALQTIEAAGYDKAVLYDYKPKSLSELEKVLGKKKFSEIVGEYIFKPTGKPTLVTVDDKRPSYIPGMDAFDGVVADA